MTKPTDNAMDKETFKDITELSEEDALDSIKEMVAYMTKETDQEYIDNYSGTFMLICTLHAQSKLKEACKAQRKICAKKIKDGYNLDPMPNSNRVNDMVEEDILTAPEPKL